MSKIISTVHQSHNVIDFQTNEPGRASEWALMHEDQNSMFARVGAQICGRTFEPSVTGSPAGFTPIDMWEACGSIGRYLVSDQAAITYAAYCSATNFSVTATNLRTSTTVTSGFGNATTSLAWVYHTVYVPQSFVANGTDPDLLLFEPEWSPADTNPEIQCFMVYETILTDASYLPDGS